jgi:subtilisin family serine protease
VYMDAEEHRTLVVAPGNINTERQIPYLELAATEKILLVSMTDIAGQQTPVSAVSDKIVMAPGVQIPSLDADGSWKPARGTAFACAIAAGAAANVIALSPIELAPPQIVGALQKTARITDTRESRVRVIDVASAVARVQADQQARVSVNSAILRASPDMKSKKIISLRRGTRVQILNTSGDWVHIRAGNRLGYVSRNLLSIGG